MKGDPRMTTLRPTRGITEREREIINLIGEGHSNGSIGVLLSISVETVKRHVSNIFNKTGCESRLMIAVKALNGDLQ